MKYFPIFFFSLIIVVSCHNNSTTASNTSTTVLKDSIENTDWALLPFVKIDSVNPIMAPGTNSFIDPILHTTVLWEQKDVFNPAIVVKDNKVYMLYRAQDKIGKPDGTSRIGLAISEDGIHFKRMNAPVLYPTNDAYKKLEWQGGCEDPRVVEDDKGEYYMTYTAFDGDSARLMIATSKDLLNWKKEGHVFASAFNGKYVNTWTKSGSIVCKYENGKAVATKINNKYWMYWGDCFIWSATSDDLIHWTPVEMTNDEKPIVELKSHAVAMPRLKIVIPTRNKKFDSDLVEPGPPAMLTDKGILLIYNSRNIPSIGDSLLAEGTYAAAQVLLDKNDPTKILHRMNTYFIKPDKKYEYSGQVNNVCFLEGLAFFKNKCYLYYGTADSKIAVAVKEMK